MKDNGLGIKKENYKNIFKLFGSHINEKKKLNTDGIGLGLMICKMIVEKFDGSINFASKYKKGVHLIGILLKTRESQTKSALDIVSAFGEVCGGK